MWAKRTQILTIFMLTADSWKPRPRRIYAHRKPVNVSGNWWQPSSPVSLLTSSFATSYNEPMLQKYPDTLRRPNSICWSYNTGDTPYKIVPTESKNLFQFEMDQKDSWYTLTPGIVYQYRLAVFGLRDVSPVAVHSFPWSQDAGNYTRSELSSFWDSILISAASRNALKKFSQKLLVFSNNNSNQDSFPYYAFRTDFFVENMISPGFSKDRFIYTFGQFAYVPEHCGTYFSVFLLFFKLFINVVVMMIPHLELTTQTGASVGFGKTPSNRFIQHLSHVSFDFHVWFQRASTCRGRRREKIFM